MNNKNFLNESRLVVIIAGVGVLIFGVVLGFVFGIQTIPKRLTVAKIQQLLDDADVKIRTADALLIDGDGRKYISNKMLAIMSAQGMLKDLVLKKNGKIFILKEGKLEELKEVIPTTNKGAIDTSGKVIEQNGTYRSLEEDQMVTIDGKIIKKL